MAALCLCIWLITSCQHKGGVVCCLNKTANADDQTPCQVHRASRLMQNNPKHSRERHPWVDTKVQAVTSCPDHARSSYRNRYKVLIRFLTGPFARAYPLVADGDVNVPCPSTASSVPSSRSTATSEGCSPHRFVATICTLQFSDRDRWVYLVVCYISERPANSVSEMIFGRISLLVLCWRALFLGLFMAAIAFDLLLVMGATAPVGCALKPSLSAIFLRLLLRFFSEIGVSAFLLISLGVDSGACSRKMGGVQ